MVTYNEIFLETRKILLNSGYPDSARCARILLAEITGKTVEQLVRDYSLYTSDDVRAKVIQCTQRLLQNEPIEYITGYADFCGCRIKVNRNVLIPRPDTELLVQSACDISFGKISNPRILDLCTGSGCIACALAVKIPSSKIVAVDISNEALDIARNNIQSIGVSSRVTCMQADVLHSPPVGVGYFDIIVSNPPYIESAEISALDASVKDFEPIIALDGGNDGLNYYRSIIKYWKMQLEGGGYIIFEVGENQAKSVCEMLDSAGFSKTETKLDASGTERVVIGRL